MNMFYSEDSDGHWGGLGSGRSKKEIEEIEKRSMAMLDEVIAAIKSEFTNTLYADRRL